MKERKSAWDRRATDAPKGELPDSKCCDGPLAMYYSPFARIYFFACTICREECDATGERIVTESKDDRFWPSDDVEAALRTLKEAARFDARFLSGRSERDRRLAQQMGFLMGAAWKTRTSCVSEGPDMEITKDEAARQFPLRGRMSFG